MPHDKSRPSPHRGYLPWAVGLAANMAAARLLSQLQSAADSHFVDTPSALRCGRQVVRHHGSRNFAAVAEVAPQKYIELIERFTA